MVLGIMYGHRSGLWRRIARLFTGVTGLAGAATLLHLQCERLHSPPHVLHPAETGGANSADGGSTRRELNLLISEQLDAELQFSPTLATWLGDHSSDDRLDDVRSDNIGREIARLDGMAERLRRLAEQERTAPSPAPPSPSGPAPSLGDIQRLDLQLLQARVESKRQELLELRPFERNPIYYTNLIAFGLDGLISTNLMSLSGMRALRGRLAAIPGLCREAQRNLKNPPELWTRRAVEVAQLTRDFVALLLPRVLANITMLDPALLDDVNHQREVAQRALEDFANWLGHDLLSHSKGDWSLPRDRFLARLRAAEMLDVSLDTLQNLVEFEARETKRHLDDLARRVLGQTSGSPTRAISEALRAVEEDHSRPEEILRAAESALDRAVEMVTAQKFVSLPPARPQVMEMPAHRFGFVLLSMPARLEPERPAQLYIDPVDQSWKDRKRIGDHLRMLNRSQLLLSALHEVFPGQYTQQMVERHQQNRLSPLRLRTLSPAFLEGWSHYAEQSILQEAPLNSAASEKLLFLGLRIQLLRLGRLLMALRLHAPLGVAPQPAARLEDAVRFFTEECYLDEYAARREAERLTYDPLCGLGALGQLQLSQLRLDAQKEQGERFNLQGFHDALLAQGALPVVALRRILLLHPGPSLLAPPEPPPSGEVTE